MPRILSRTFCGMLSNSIGVLRPGAFGHEPCNDTLAEKTTEQIDGRPDPEEVPRGKRGRLGRVDREIQSAHLLHSNQVPNAAARGIRRFPIRLFRAVDPPARLTRTKSASRVADSGDSPSVLPLETAAAAPYQR